MRLIDADALQEPIVELLDLAIKRVEDTPNDSPCYRMYVAQENERSRFIDLIDNAPTVELTETEIQEVLNKRCMTAVTNEYLIALRGAEMREVKETPIRCKDCKHQKKYWHEDKRMKEKGYWIYGCDLIDDHFVGTPVWGQDNQFCSSAERKEEA